MMHRRTTGRNPCRKIGISRNSTSAENSNDCPAVNIPPLSVDQEDGARENRYLQQHGQTRKQADGDHGAAQQVYPTTVYMTLEDAARMPRFPLRAR